ncbi:hypothetical protein GCM10011581_30430 [Saccharopolyspora subtropica]|nr:hypothetical protein [Saccharopolyspora subtropica]GGI91282.1 hypothetical protein GCM10011581_30430 [Saccharopolyspora subtropica]
MPGWRDLHASAEVIAQAGRRLEESSRRLAESPEELTTARDALRLLTAVGSRLARQLDTLANAYSTPNQAEPSAVHIALDQAAAAAEDLGNCTKVAAQAIEDEK